MRGSPPTTLRAALACALLAACTPSSPVTGSGTTSGGSTGSGGGATQTGLGGAPVLPPIQATPTTAPTVCPGGLRPKAYLLGYGPTLFELDPETLEMHALGTLTLSSFSNQPVRMTVSQTGAAYLFFVDANVYRLDLATLARTPTAYVPGQLGFGDESQLDYYSFPWMTLTPSDDHLYMISHLTTTTLAVSNLVDFKLKRIGDIEPHFDSRRLTDVRTDASGRIFGLTSYGSLVEIDATTGAMVAEDATGFQPPEPNTCYLPWATPDGSCGRPLLLPYDGALYFIGGTVAGVVRYDLATKTLKPLGQLLTDVWAVSAMTCVHAPSGPDAGADAAPDGAADAGP